MNYVIGLHAGSFQANQNPSDLTEDDADWDRLHCLGRTDYMNYVIGLHAGSFQANQNPSDLTEDEADWDRLHCLGRTD